MELETWEIVAGVACAVAVVLVMIYLGYFSIGFVTAAYLKSLIGGVQGLSSKASGYMIPDLAYSKASSVIANAWQ